MTVGTGATDDDDVGRSGVVGVKAVILAMVVVVVVVMRDQCNAGFERRRDICSRELGNQLMTKRDMQQTAGSLALQRVFVMVMEIASCRAVG